MSASAFTVESSHPVRVEAADDEQITLLNEGDTIYYKQDSAVSATNNDGSLTNGQQITLTIPTWIRSASASFIQTLPAQQNPTDELVLRPTASSRNKIISTSNTVSPFATGTFGANTMLAGGAPLHANPAGSPGIQVTGAGDVLFGTNELVTNGTGASSTWTYGKSVFDGLYSALNKRWYMRSNIIVELGDPPDLILGRFGPNDTYPVNTGSAADLAGVPTNTSLGKLSFRGGITVGGGTPDVTGGSSLSGATSAIYGRSAEALSSTAQGGHLVFQTTPIGSATIVDVARFASTGKLELGANFDTNLYSSASDTLKTDDSMVIAGANGLLINNVTTGTLFMVGGTANVNRWIKAGGDGKFTIRQDDNSVVPRAFTLQNAGITAADQGIGIAAQFGTGNGTPADAGSIRFLTEGDWATSGAQDSYILFRTATDGTVADRARVTSGGDFKLLTGGLVLPELGSLATPAANNVYLAARDNGSGKTQAVLVFESGNTVVLGTDF